MSTVSELSHLIALLDDPDETVSHVVSNKIMNFGLPVTGFLKKELRKSNNNVLTNRLEHLITNIELDHLFKEIEKWSKEPDPELIMGLCLISNVISHESDSAHITDTLFNMAKEVWVEMNDSQTLVEKIEIYNHIFYHRIGFRMKDPFLIDFQKAQLHNAIEIKQANPVLLGLLYIAIAQLAGIPIGAVAFPGGYIPACLRKDGQVLFYINICQSGEIFGHDQLLTILNNYGFSFPPEKFTTCNALSLTDIFAESLYFITGSIGDKELERRMEYTLTFFGDERLLFIEEDDE
ncbi:MAG: transglutaminase-like domain-containing protein [Prevotellaceae bacterium]|jgi:hypothetical protein|nr:transglutaminase-like domain-containing protein [Prevotellaceae bacterium]